MIKRSTKEQREKSRAMLEALDRREEDLDSRGLLTSTDRVCKKAAPSGEAEWTFRSVHGLTIDGKPISMSSTHTAKAHTSHRAREIAAIALGCAAMDLRLVEAK